MSAFVTGADDELVEESTIYLVAELSSTLGLLETDVLTRFESYAAAERHALALHVAANDSSRTFLPMKVTRFHELTRAES